MIHGWARMYCFWLQFLSIWYIHSKSNNSHTSLRENKKRKRFLFNDVEMKLFQCVYVCVWGGNFHSILPHALWTVKHPLTGRKSEYRHSVSVCSLCNNNFPPLPSVHIFHHSFLFRILRERKCARKTLIMSENSMWDISHTCVDISSSLLFRLECFGIDGVAWNVLLP